MKPFPSLFFVNGVGDSAGAGGGELIVVDCCGSQLFDSHSSGTNNI